MNDTNPLNNNIPNQQSFVNPSVNVMPSENAQAAPANDVAGQQVASTNINTPQTNNSPEQIVPSSTPNTCLLYTSPSPRDSTRSRMPSSA